MNPEFPHTLPLDRIGDAPQALQLEASTEQCTALANRFGLVRLDALTAKLEIRRDGDAISLTGRFTARLVQSCAASGIDLPVTLDEPLAVRFVSPSASSSEDEIELDADDCDTMEHDGLVIDAGEAVAQSLGLAINPFLRADNAEDMLRAAGVKSEAEAGPFAALAVLKGKAE